MADLYVRIFMIENIPAVIRKLSELSFVRCRSEAAKMFNSRIKFANQEWSKTGKTDYYGPYMEDVNPEYVRFLATYMARDFDKINKRHFTNCRLDEYGDIVGYVPGFKRSKIYMIFKPV